jgi:DNA-binding transcriptional LysR family regulator
METDRIVEFQILSEELNFRKAAERLALSQSSLSRHIDDLEHQLGFRLFVRDRHHVSLTSEGVKFLAEVTDLPDRLRQAIESARPTPDPSTDQMVRLGYGRTRGLELVELALATLRLGTHPIEVGLVQGGSEPIIRSLVAGELDLAFIRPPIPTGSLQGRPLVDELLGAVMREDHPMASVPTITMQEILTQPFIAVRPPSGIPVVDSLGATLRGLEMKPANIVSEADSVTSMFLLIESGLGIGLAREAVFRRANIPGLVIRSIFPPLPGIPLHLAWREQHMTPSVRCLMDLIVDCRARLGTGYRLSDET